jgi:putative transposase
MQAARLMRFVPRKHLPHDVPSSVPAGALFFITIHCAARGAEQLTLATTAERLLNAAAYYHERGRWFVRLFLLMPDHVHGLLAFPPAESMRAVVADWKRFTARTAGVQWQRDFFDHRIRAGENWQIKGDYIRANPVRKGLAAHVEDWPWVYAP